jgi:hypothetical protein
MALPDREGYRLPMSTARIDPPARGETGPVRSMMKISPFVGRAVAVLVFGIAFGYVEAAVVVDLRTALGLAPGPVFPLAQATARTGSLVGIEVGRELATIGMLIAVGWAVGLSRLERLAWTAVAFGAWDLAYYGWLWVFIGWPPSPTSWDILFLIPVPWVAPVWAPAAVALALVGFGLTAARRLRAGDTLRPARWHLMAGVGGGALVVLSFVLGAGQVLDSAIPEGYPWPVFVAGMALAGVAAIDLVRRPVPHQVMSHLAPTTPRGT